MKSIILNDLNFEVSYQENKKNLDLIVDRSGKLFIKAPKHAKTKHLRDFVKEREFWIYTKLIEKQLLSKSKSKNLFKNGERFAYLGKTHSLMIRTKQSTPLVLKRGKFVLSDTESAREHFVDWYTKHAKTWIVQKAPKYERKLGIKPKKIRVLDLGNRWGSCSASNTLNFHWRIILAPPEIIEYVIAHEIIHMVEKNHTPEFWKKLEKIMPEYKKRKKWLSDYGHKLDL